MDYKWIALSVTTVGTLMVGISGRILVVGLTVIAAQLHADAVEVVWITQAYSVASTVTLLVAGRITDLFGRVKLYNLGFIVFTAGSILSAVSQDSHQLIAFRIVQGIGTGMLVTNAAAIVTDASPRNELGMMLGVNQMARRVGNVAGLTISGAILSVVDWRGLFYINIPIGIFGTIWAFKRLREVGTRDATKRMDFPGFATFTTGLVSMLLAITFLSYGLSSSAYGYGLLALGFALMAAFVMIESRSRSPLLDPKLFRIRLFAAGNMAQVLNSVAWGGILLLLAFYLEVGLQYTPLQTGLALIPLDATYIASTLAGGKLSDKYGTRVLTTAGLVVNSAALFYLSTFGGATPYPVVAVALVAVGVGNGLFTPPNLKAIMGSVPANRVGVASGFRNTMFDLGVAASYGLVILFLTLGVPYGTLSLLLQGAVPQQAALLARAEFFTGFRAAMLILAVVDTVAIVPSALRGQRATDAPGDGVRPPRATAEL